jgi:hypothetical protein
MQCPECKRSVADFLTNCPDCGNSLGFPNVRAAADNVEVQDLATRYGQAVSDAQTRGTDKLLTEFENVVRAKSRAVICRPLGTLKKLLDSGDGLFQTFYRQIALGRSPESNKYDLFRTSVDNLLFPYYHERIHFAALSLDSTGTSSYGGGRPCILLLNETIRNRASVFEENLFLYCERTKHPATAPIPPGFRASWDERHKLAVAKLGGGIKRNSTSSDFPGILLQSGKTTGDDKFIEVHIHDPLTHAAVEVARLPKVKSGLTKLKEKAEKTMLKYVQEELESLGVKSLVV